MPRPGRNRPAAELQALSDALAHRVLDGADLAAFLHQVAKRPTELGVEGLRLVEATISGDLILRGLIWPRPLALKGCLITGDLRIIDAQIEDLDLADSSTEGSLALAATHVTHGVVLPTVAERLEVFDLDVGGWLRFPWRASVGLGGPGPRRIAPGEYEPELQEAVENSLAALRFELRNVSTGLDVDLQGVVCSELHLERCTVGGNLFFLPRIRGQNPEVRANRVEVGDTLWIRPSFNEPTPQIVQLSMDDFQAANVQLDTVVCRHAETYLGRLRCTRLFLKAEMENGEGEDGDGETVTGRTVTVRTVTVRTVTVRTATRRTAARRTNAPRR